MYKRQPTTLTRIVKVRILIPLPIKPDNIDVRSKKPMVMGFFGVLKYVLKTNFHRCHEAVLGNGRDSNFYMGISALEMALMIRRKRME